MSTGSKSQRRHRASVSATAGIPRPLKRVFAGASLAIVLAGSLAYANITGGLQHGDRSATLGPDLQDRGVWSETSREGGERSELGPLEADPVTFSVRIDGEEMQLTSAAATLADALTDHGILVGLDDQVSGEMNQPPQDGAEIEVVRVGTVFGAETEVVEFDVEERETSALPRGTRQVQTEGVNGERVVTYMASYEDGEEVSRTNQSEILATAPVTEVVLVGTGAPHSTGSSGSSGSSSSSSSSASSASGDPRGIARQMVEDRGWGSDQFDCLDRLWQKESNWNHTAQNPSSGAYGIPQSLPGSKMATAGADWRTNPATQITWGLNYISGRYGTPCGAWAHSQAHNWY